MPPWIYQPIDTLNLVYLWRCDVIKSLHVRARIVSSAFGLTLSVGWSVTIPDFQYFKASPLFANSYEAGSPLLPTRLRSKLGTD